MAYQFALAAKVALLLACFSSGANGVMQVLRSPIKVRNLSVALSCSWAMMGSVLVQSSFTIEHFRFPHLEYLGVS
jgi:hypothetical protein